MKVTVIDCPNCKEQGRGDYLGVISDGTGYYHLHKCLKCKQHVRYDIKNGVNYA